VPPTHLSPSIVRFSSPQEVTGMAAVPPSPRVVPSMSRPLQCFMKWWGGMSVVTCSRPMMAT
jgi:hypothetical protein